MIQWLRKLFGPRESLLEEFVRVFPDRCPICACHRFGLSQGFVTGDTPKHEGCIEEKPSIRCIP